MALPDFDEREKYPIAYMKSESRSSWDPHTIGVLGAGIFLCCAGAYYDNVPRMACAFFVLCGFKLYGEQYQRKWQLLWRSVFSKYQAAISAGGQHDG